MIKGRRIYPDEKGNLILHPGDYGKTGTGEWLARPPDTVHAGSLMGHEVIEHADGTISVMPSILITEHHGYEVRQWHGYLRNGYWMQ